MYKNKPTLAIYGIQDRFDYEHPFYVHDHNLAFMHNGKVEWFLQQERISRRKRDNSLHIHLKEILKEKKLLGKDYDLVFVDNVVGRTFLLQNGEVRFEAPLNSELSTGLEKGKCWWFGEEKEAWVLNHEMAHMFSSLPFFGDLKENSLLVHFDGGASLSNFSAAVYKNGRLEWLEYHWDLKPYSTLFNANALVFAIIGAKLPEQNAVPGKFMGFSGLGTYRPELGDWLKNNNFFQDIWGKTSVFFDAAKKDWGVDLKSFNQKDPFIQDVAATLQELFTQEILKKLQELQQETSAENLYYTGGSALNIVANTRIVNSGLFKQVFIPPCTEDSGLALGAAAFAEWIKTGKIEVNSAYLNNWGIENYYADFSEQTINEIADQLAAKKLVGVCNNFGEAGPRALGNRSILAFAGSKELSKKLSMEKKGREWYRPLAPVALEENIKYFTGQSEIHSLAKFMLLDFAVLPEKQQEIAGAIHADGTARFQSISKETDNPFLFALLKRLDEKYGIKALINTSFNAGGEPIVHTEEDALRSAKEMQLDGVVINGKFVQL
ncbi:carbamoyltransferase C-terminal domain-containing protein [Draconibacterium sp. IB214405]|uniref:carbamoyltransferase C-terminal domain-containing protein n=1 Tax=Draconibacterium sp. IB214405 TaxID=3097352 RepID=UPI002A0DCBBD|nr:carbamoyltransferase C-terminal domain-containing protein [Draconibacterium sp. IB214405]MDX8337702.1 carbamoyltransferase C-terminal domain-containing protein [Draconibacterium sp. IB214405]